MKKTILLLITVCTTIALSAQLRLDVEGDAKILGRLDLNTGKQNVFIGTGAGINTNLTSTGENVFIGFDAGYSNTTGFANVFIGREAGVFNTTGEDNTFVGQSAGRVNKTGEDNAFIGRDAGRLNETGGNNTFIGKSAGDDNITGTRNTLLGSEADITIDSLDRAIAIGHNATVACHNCAVIGGTGADAVNVGISTTNPQTKLHIEGGIDASLSKHGYLVNGPINGQNLVIDNNEIMSRDNGATSELYLNANGGNVGVNVASPPTAKLHVKGSVRFQDLPTASDGFIVGIDASGNLFRNVLPSVNSLLDNKSTIILEEQTELIKTKSREITDLKTENDYQNEIIEDLEDKMEVQQQQMELQNQQIAELKSLVEKLITQNTETPKSTSYVLPLQQQALLTQNQPNPFRENTLVDYFVPADVQNAHIQVTSVDGKVLGQVKITEMGKGQVTIQSKNYPAGTYFYSLVLDGQVMETMRMVLTR